MSKKKDKKKKPKVLGDVTINDYANSSVIGTRERKSTASLTTVTTTWEDINDSFDFVPEETPDGTVAFVLKKLPASTTPGNSYPIDLYFAISKYIRLEDVGRFASTCQACRTVTNTASFWYGVYKRFYRGVPHLPKELQPASLRIHQLRSLVIRALFYFYAPFASRISAPKPDQHPDVLLKHRCRLMWRTQHKKFWIYNFKLHSECGDSGNTFGDVAANVEANCRILRAVCTTFVLTPPIEGMYLLSTKVCLTQDLRQQTLLLTFGTSAANYAGDNHRGDNQTIFLNPMVKMTILDWWHPLYPHAPPTFDKDELFGDLSFEGV